VSATVVDIGDSPRTERARREIQEATLVAGMVSGLSVTEAAEKAGMGRTVAYASLKRPEVRERITQASAEATSAAARKAAGMVSGALDVLWSLANGANGEGVRRQASTDLLTHARAFRTDAEVEERMAELSRELDAIVSSGVSRVA
jgi:hypothetical protein